LNGLLGIVVYFLTVGGGATAGTVFGRMRDQRHHRNLLDQYQGHGVLFRRRSFSWCLAGALAGFAGVAFFMFSDAAGLLGGVIAFLVLIGMAFCIAWFYRGRTLVWDDERIVCLSSRPDICLAWSDISSAGAVPFSELIEFSDIHASKFRFRDQDFGAHALYAQLKSRLGPSFGRHSSMLERVG
jgi:hypothetical protein